MKITKTIRGLEQELFQQARSEALKQGKNIGDYVNEALAEKLHITDAGKKGEK